MKVTLYLSEKSREHELGDALSKGFQKHGDEVETIPTQHYVQPKGDTQVAVMVGVKGRSKQIFEDHRRAGRHTIYIDKSYFDRGEYYRVSLDNFQPAYAHEKPRPHDRLDRLKLNIAGRQPRGKHVIYAGSSQKYCDWHGLGDVNVYAGGACHAINKTASKIDTGPVLAVHYRPKPSWAAGHPDEVVRDIPNTIYSAPTESFQKLLHNCHALVTHGSNAAVEAIVAGVPAVLLSKEGASAAWPVAEHSLENGLAAPFFPPDDARRQWLADLAYCQWTLDEMRSGAMWAALLPMTAKGVPGLDGMNELDRTIAMYRMMHRGPKMFRGASIKGHIEAIGDCVQRYGAKTLLDFGCGKGAQYTELKVHERWGVPMPALYDPGVPGIDVLPGGPFDGVISTDVMEHIPEAHVEEVLRQIIERADKFAFLCIFTEPSRKFLPDGRNCHVTVRPEAWWLDRVAAVANGAVDRTYDVTKPLPGGAFEQFKHYVITRCDDRAEVIVTFRGTD